MPKFIYKAKQGPNKIVEGVIEAESIDGAVAKVLQAGYTPIDIRSKEEKEKDANKIKIFDVFQIFSKKIPSSAIVLFTRQVSDLIDAEVPLLSALNIIGKQTSHQNFKTIIRGMYSFVKDGGAFSDALLQSPLVFPQLYVSMVKAGERGGNLDVIMRRLAEFMEKDQEAVSQVKTSLIYPSLILVVGGVVIFGLLTWVIPGIMTVFDDLGTTLPLPTRILLGISEFFANFWWAIAGGTGCTVLYIKRMNQTTAGRLWIDDFRLKIPIFGDFVKDAEIGRFARTLGTLLGNGVVIVSALESVIGVVENSVLKKEIKGIVEEVSNGSSMTNALRGKMFFSETAISMIAVSEESGKMHEGLLKLALYYERQTQRVMKRILSLIEPVLILILGSVVGFVVIAMLMPMFKMDLIIQ